MKKTDLQKYQLEHHAILQLEKDAQVTSIDWLEFKVAGELDHEILSMLQSKFQVSPKSSLVYKCIYDFENCKINDKYMGITLSFGLRGATARRNIKQYYHIKVSNECLYENDYRTTYEYFKHFVEDSHLFKYIDIENSSVSRLDVCFDVPLDSDNYHIIKSRFDGRSLGWGKRKLKTTSDFDEYSSDKYRAMTLQKKQDSSILPELPPFITKYKEYNNRGAFATNFTAGNRASCFFFRFYDKTLENTGSGNLPKKQYIQQLHEKTFGKVGHVYRLECEIKLDKLPISFIDYNQIIIELLDYYITPGLRNEQIEPYIFRKEFVCEREKGMTMEKQFRLFTALLRYLSTFKEDSDITTKALIVKLNKRLENTNYLPKSEHKFEISEAEEFELLMDRIEQQSKFIEIN